jgi:hypothetical protein
MNHCCLNEYELSRLQVSDFFSVHLENGYKNIPFLHHSLSNALELLPFLHVRC